MKKLLLVLLLPLTFVANAREKDVEKSYALDRTTFEVELFLELHLDKDQQVCHTVTSPFACSVAERSPSSE